jgi:hypothetical protein
MITYACKFVDLICQINSIEFDCLGLSIGCPNNSVTTESVIHTWHYFRTMRTFVLSNERHHNQTIAIDLMLTKIEFTSKYLDRGYVIWFLRWASVNANKTID